VSVGPGDSNGKLSLLDMTMTGEDGVTTINLGDKFLSVPVFDERGAMTLSIAIGSLEYQNYKLTGRFAIEHSGTTNTYPISVSLEPAYREKKINRFFSALMSI